METNNFARQNNLRFVDCLDGSMAPIVVEASVTMAFTDQMNTPSRAVRSDWRDRSHNEAELSDSRMQTISADVSLSVCLAKLLAFHLTAEI